MLLFRSLCVAREANKLCHLLYRHAQHPVLQMPQGLMHWVAAQFHGEMKSEKKCTVQAMDCNFLYFNLEILDAVLAETCARPEEARKLPYLLNAFSDAHSLLGSCSGSAGPSHEVRASPFNDMFASSAWQTDPPLASRLFCQACLAACKTCLPPAARYDWLLNVRAKHGLPCLSLVDHAWHDCCRA